MSFSQEEILEIPFHKRNYLFITSKNKECSRTQKHKNNKILICIHFLNQILFINLENFFIIKM